MSKTSPDARRDEGDLGANEYGRLTWALAGVSDLPPAEVRTLVRFDPARAHRRLEEFCEEGRRAICEDLAAIRSAARDKQDQRRREDEYRDAVLLRHNRVLNAAREAYARRLEDASQAELAQVGTGAASGSSWRTAMNIGERAAGALAAPRRPAGLRRTPAARPAARRPQVRRRSSSSSRSGSDPPGSTEGDDDPAGRVARLTFPHLHRLTAGLSGAVRLERFEALSPGAQNACWRDLARELEEIEEASA